MPMRDEAALLRLSFELASSSDVETTVMLVHNAALRLGIEARQIHEDDEAIRPTARMIEISANEDRLRRLVGALTAIPGIGLVTIERAATSGEAAI